MSQRSFGARAFHVRAKGANLLHLGLVSELLASLVAGGPIHKKQAIDQAVGNTSLNAQTFQKAIREFLATLTALKQIFPDLRSTRFKNISEFYTLFLIVWEMHQQKMVLNDKRRNAVAMKLLRSFSNGVDDVREHQRQAKGAAADQRLCADYLLQVQQSTDALAPRKRRAEMIRHLLDGLFERKDERRIFSAEQRRMLWHGEEKKRCSQCNDELDWTNFQIDHVKPYSRGGKTELRNAALICVSCNASKGAGKYARREAA